MNRRLVACIFAACLLWISPATAQVGVGGGGPGAPNPGPAGPTPGVGSMADSITGAGSVLPGNYIRVHEESTAGLSAGGAAVVSDVRRARENIVFLLEQQRSASSQGGSTSNASAAALATALGAATALNATERSAYRLESLRRLEEDWLNTLAKQRKGSFNYLQNLQRIEQNRIIQKQVKSDLKKHFDHLRRLQNDHNLKLFNVRDHASYTR